MGVDLGEGVVHGPDQENTREYLHDGRHDGGSDPTQQGVNNL